MDVFSQGVETTNDGHIKLFPIHDQGRKTAVHVASHLHRLVKILKKKSLPMGKIEKKKIFF